MADRHQSTIDRYIRGARQGYREDAELLLTLASKYIQESTMPLNLKEYLVEGFRALMDQDQQAYAFYLKKRGSGKRLDKSKVWKDMEVAGHVLTVMLYEQQGKDKLVLRQEPLSVEDAVADVADSRGVSEGSVRNAYYEHREALLRD